jgi:hypothetical protein
LTRRKKAMTVDDHRPLRSKPEWPAENGAALRDSNRVVGNPETGHKRTCGKSVTQRSWRPRKRLPRKKKKQ